MGQATPGTPGNTETNPSGLGAPYYDPDMPEMSPEEVEGLCRKHYAEVALLVVAFSHTKDIPRRLGEVTAQELAQDKKAARRLIHLYGQLEAQWRRAGLNLDGIDEPSGSEARKFGAQVIVPTWCRSRVATIEARAECIVTNLVHFGDRRRVNRTVLLFNNELAGLGRTLQLY